MCVIFVMLCQMPAERQTMLFSATLPSWVSKVAKRYQKDPRTIDLVGEHQTGKLNEDVTLNIMQVGRHRGSGWSTLQCSTAVFLALNYIEVEVAFQECRAASRQVTGMQSSKQCRLQELGLLRRH